MRTTPAVSIATSVPAPMAMPRSAWARAGASLTPSPTMATLRPLRWSSAILAALSPGRQNLGWAIGYNAIALPIAAGVFEPAFGLVLRPEIAALAMSGSSFIVAVNALALKGLRLPGTRGPAR